MTFGSCGKKDKKKKRENNWTAVCFFQKWWLRGEQFHAGASFFRPNYTCRPFPRGNFGEELSGIVSSKQLICILFRVVFYPVASFLVSTKSCQILHHVIQEVPNCVCLLLDAEVYRGDFIAFLSENSCLLQLKRTPWWLWQASTTVKTLAGQLNNELKAETVALE